MLSEALGHIDRNHSLLWMDQPISVIDKLWDEMVDNNLVELNNWSGAWFLTPAGREALKQ